MLDIFSQQLNQIIALSESILSCLSDEFEDKEDNEEELLEWNVERDRLIKLSFNEEQSENYSQHLPLINKVLALDNQLTKQAEKNKLVLKTSLLNMKKNQKASNAYKKY